MSDDKRVLTHNLVGLDDITSISKVYTQQNKTSQEISLVVPIVEIHKKDLNARKMYNAEDIRLVGCESRLQKSTYPIKLYVNHDEIDMDLEWGWVNLFKLFCGYCISMDYVKFLELGDTKCMMGLPIARSREDLLTNVTWHKESKVLHLHDLWFNLNRKGRDIGVAIFRISDFMGFKYVAIEVKKYDNSEF